VARGQSEKHPDPDNPNYDRDHYVDYHGNYHVTTPAIWPKRDTITYGFKIDTQEAGEYRLKISIVADGIPSSYLLDLHVEPSFLRDIPCIAEPHRNCVVRLKYPAG
jgi:hypothetical protein